MPDILDHHSSKTIKLFSEGEQGNGKTGALMSLVANNYKLRIIDFDNGADILRTMLTSYDYPYRPWMEKNNFPLKGAINVKTIAEVMVKHRSEERFIPKNAMGWIVLTNMLENWKDGEIQLGPVESWEDNTILAFDTFGTIAESAFYYAQQLNNHLGDRFDEYGRDTNVAQGMLREFLKKLFHPAIKTNIIINAHIIFVDLSGGIAEAPRRRDPNSNKIDYEAMANIKGYPQAIGRALSPVAGKYFNNVLLIDQPAGTNKHEIVTNPSRGIAIKNSNPAGLKPRYPVETGYAEIFAKLKGEPEPQEFLDFCKNFHSKKPTQVQVPKSGPITLEQLAAK